MNSHLPKTGIWLGHSFEYNPPVASRYHWVKAILVNLDFKDHHGLWFVWSTPHKFSHPRHSHPHPLWLGLFVFLSLLCQRCYCVSFGYQPPCFSPRLGEAPFNLYLYRTPYMHFWVNYYLILFLSIGSLKIYRWNYFVSFLMYCSSIMTLCWYILDI